MTNTIVDFGARRRRLLNSRIPTSAPDFELHAWLKDQEVQWIYAAGEFLGEEESHRIRTSALLDAVWIYGKDLGEDVPERDRPIFWWTLNADGHHTFIYATTLYERTSWKHAWWFCRQWWRLTKRCGRLAWRIWKGRG